MYKRLSILRLASHATLTRFKTVGIVPVLEPKLLGVATIVLTEYYRVDQIQNLLFAIKSFALDGTQPSV